MINARESWEARFKAWRSQGKTFSDMKGITLNREIESYMVKNQQWGEMSCEMIASALIYEFGLCYAQVMEDGENGAEVEIN